MFLELIDINWRSYFIAVLLLSFNFEAEFSKEVPCLWGIGGGK
jgi:hypothetical protein